MQILHLLFGLLTNRGLEIHFEYVASRIKLLRVSFSTSFLSASYLSGLRAHLFYLCSVCLGITYK